MDKRYQVFVSSTYADLQEERQRVIQALMEMDCIPAGMELFPAADEEQWEFIKRVIDDCDYYLLMIGGRYGTTTADGVSYTEREYDYAVESGLRVIALLHAEPDEIPVSKSDIDPELRGRLTAFRERVASHRLVKFWSPASELPGLVALSLSKTIKAYPATGWIRGDRAPSEQLLNELAQVRRENSALQERIRELEAHAGSVPPDIARLDEEITLHGSYWARGTKRSWESTVSWNEIFGYISPYLVQYPNDAAVKGTLAEALASREGFSYGDTFTMDDQEFRTVAVQLKALGLITLNYTKTVKGGMGLFWSSTPKGERLMLELRTVRSQPQ